MFAPHSSHPKLPRARRHLLDLCCRLGTGRLEHVYVRGGLPQFDPPPLAVTRVPLTQTSPSLGVSTANFELYPEQVALLALLDRLGDGVLHRVEICNGLPVVVEHAI